jgi:hypothetical protein
MQFIPRPPKRPARRRLTCSVPEATATLLQRYCEYRPCTREYVIVHALDDGCRRDKAFQAWLATHYPATGDTAGDPLPPPIDASRPTPAPVEARPTAPSRPDPRADRARS